MHDLEIEPNVNTRSDSQTRIRNRTEEKKSSFFFHPHANHHLTHESWPLTNQYKYIFYLSKAPHRKISSAFYDDAVDDANERTTFTATQSDSQQSQISLIVHK